jgi:ADP-dependent NAD(P)H-hydrate dehydratase
MTNISLPELPPRAAESHKGDFGRALLVGGSRGMSGAIALAGMSTLRSGAGLVTLATPAACLDVVASFEPSYMTVPLANDEDGRIAYAAQPTIEQLAKVATCVACGPGLGRSDELRKLVPAIYQTIAKPMVIDADGLNALASRPELLAKHGGPRILTPHPGEFRRLVGKAAENREQLEKMAIQMAADTGTVIVLKGHRTLITDGNAALYNSTGNPGMATGGSGDVLTGIITALICQSMSPLEATQLGVHLHGLAGDLAAAELGQESMIASDLVGFLSSAFLQYRA